MTAIKEVGQIEESNSAWCSSVLIVPKKLEDPNKPKFRFWLIFETSTKSWSKIRTRYLESMTFYMHLQEPKTSQRLTWPKVIYKWDLRKKREREYCILCRQSTLPIQSMPFGLCDAPATFQRLMDRVLRKLPWKYSLVYLDDIIIFARNFEMHLERLELVLIELKRANLKLRPSKCRFSRRK